MKKIYLFLILSLQGLFLAAQTVSINLDEQHIADVLTPDVQASVTQITLSGHMSAADYAFVNDCPSLTKLDMTDVIIDSIPAFCLAKATSLADLYLPKKQTVFNFYAVKNDITGNVTAHVTGLFPDLDVPLTGDRLAATDVLFTVEKENDRYFETEQGYIFSANMDTLYRFAQKDLDWATADAYAVVIRPYAFAWLKLYTGFELSLYPALELICQHAFEGVRWLPYNPETLYHNYADFVVYLGNTSDKNKYPIPQLEGPVSWNTEEYRSSNGTLLFYIYEGHFKSYLENSCFWAGTDMMDSYNCHMFDPELIDTEKRYDKDGNLLQYVKPHIVFSEWHANIIDTDNVTFNHSSEDNSSSMIVEMDVEYGAFYTYVYSWTMIERDYPNPLYPYFHTQEYRDTIYSPIPEGDDLTYECEIYDDEGNLLYSNKRKGDKGSSEHLSGTLTNVPKSQQGDLKSRTTVMRYGASPWRSQRVSFGPTAIPSLELPPTSGSSYDLTGRPVHDTQKGLLIRNGKKILIK